MRNTRLTCGTVDRVQERQLGRPAPEEQAAARDKRDLWYASPKLIPNIGEPIASLALEMLNLGQKYSEKMSYSKLIPVHVM